MAEKAKHLHRPRAQTPEQEAAELALHQRLQREKPSLQNLLDRGDIAQVFSMGEYWELSKTFAGLKTLREQHGLSISELAERTGMDSATISGLESGHIDNPTIATVTRYAKAFGKRVIVSLVDATTEGGRKSN